MLLWRLIDVYIHLHAIVAPKHVILTKAIPIRFHRFICLLEQLLRLQPLPLNEFIQFKIEFKLGHLLPGQNRLLHGLETHTPQTHQ